MTRCGLRILLVVKIGSLIPNFLFLSFSPITPDCLHPGHKTQTLLCLSYPDIQVANMMNAVKW